MGNPEIKVLIEEISKLRSEIIEMKIEIEGLKADIAAIGEVNKASSGLKVVGENSVGSNGKLTLIKSKKSGKAVNEKNNQDNNLKVEIEQTPKNIQKEIDKKENDINLDDLKIDKKDVKVFREKLKSIMKSQVRYDTWLKTGVENLSKTSKNDFVFPTANDFTRGIVEVRYKELVLEVLKDVFKDVNSVKIVEI